MLGKVQPLDFGHRSCFIPFHLHYMRKITTLFTALFEKSTLHHSKRVGREVSRCCGWPLCCSFWVGASHLVLGSFGLVLLSLSV